MSKLSPVSFSELVKKLKALDFEGPFSGGKHLIMIKSDLRLTIPNPHRQDIGVDLCDPRVLCGRLFLFLSSNHQ